ncbi:MAG TPA: carboxypeptidase-like regulatory domain-containing protein, partial [Terriglobales bacterium]|nr:carboxypeptidase-like regulatory domain-containing protein [Terriglobales bacterium]
MRRVVQGGLCAILALSVGQNVDLRAQQVQGSFTGTVRDQSGALIPGVTVTAVDSDTGMTRSSLTQGDGSYTIPLLPPGQYRLAAEKAGFEKTIKGPLN